MGRDNAPQHAQTPQHPLQTKCRSSPLPYGDQNFCSRTLPRRVALASMKTLSPRTTERVFRFGPRKCKDQRGRCIDARTRGAAACLETSEAMQRPALRERPNTILFCFRFGAAKLQLYVFRFGAAKLRRQQLMHGPERLYTRWRFQMHHRRTLMSEPPHHRPARRGRGAATGRGVRSTAW